MLKLQMCVFMIQQNLSGDQALHVTVMVKYTCAGARYADMHHAISKHPVYSPVHDNVIKWKHLPRYWPFVRGICRSPLDSPHKGQRRGALMFSLICAWTNGWANGTTNKAVSAVSGPGFHLIYYRDNLAGTCTIMLSCNKYPCLASTQSPVVQIQHAPF